VSKRSIRLVAGIAGAAMALGSMAPAVAVRLGGDDVDGSIHQVVDLDCLEGLAPDLFPLNANVSPLEIFDNFPGLLDVGLGATSNNPLDGQHLGLLGTPLYGALGTAAYLLDGVIDAGQCVTTDVVECVGGALADVFPINVNVNPGHPVQTGSILSPDGAVGGLLDVGINDTNNVDMLGTDGPHLGVFGEGPLGIYGIPNTLVYAGLVIDDLADCLGLPVANVLGLLACADVDGLLGRVFPVNVNVNPGDPVRLFDNNGGLLDVALNDIDNVDSADSGHLGIFGIGPLGIYGIEDTLDHLLGDTVGCVLDGGEDAELLGAVTGMSGLGGSPLSLVSPVTNTVFSLTSGLGLGILGGGGGLGLDASILASVVAVL
jgi:hypothetical protein